MSRRTTAAFVVCLALAPSAAAAQDHVWVPLFVSATVVRGLSVSAEPPAALAAQVSTGARSADLRSPGDGLRVQVDGQGPWLLRLVLPDRASLAALPAGAPRRGHTLAAARPESDAARLAWLRATLGLSGSGQATLTLPAVVPAPSRPATIVLQVAAD